MASERTALELKLIERIGRAGPITFRDFMQAALYDDTHGYYNTARPKIGKQGDYYTSSNVHPAFGAMLGRCIVDLWGRELEGRITLVEIGAGTGRLALDILRAIGDEHPAAAADLRYLIVETSPAMRRLQHRMLAPFENRVEWRELAELECSPVAAIVFSNELMDAMAVHRVRFTGGKLEESYVTASQGRLRLTWGEPSTERLAAYLERMQVCLSEGQIAEVSLGAVEWLARVSRALRSGFLITIDYGDVAAHLYSPERREGTLRSFYRHRLVESPLERVGEQDVTASVNFTALIEYGRDVGLEPVSYERQTGFLLRMGLVERVAAMEATQSVDDLKSRLAIKNLFVPGGISDSFRVLIQRKAR